MTMPIVMIATPCHSGDFPEPYVMSLIDTMANVYSQQVGVLWAPLCGKPYLEQARSILLTQFLDHPVKATHLLFVDADMSWPWHAVTELVAAKKDVIGVSYVSRHQDSYVHGVIPGAVIRDNLVRVDGTGTGFLMLSRHAALALSNAATEVMDIELNGKTVAVPFSIKCRVDKRSFVGEDVNICRQLTLLGMPTYIHVGLQVGHIRRGVVIGDQAKLREQFSTVSL